MTGAREYFLDPLLPAYDALVFASGASMPAALFARLRARAKLVLALDGGVNYLYRLREAPAAVVGDLDSATSAALRWARRCGAEIVRRPSPDAPDVAKGLSYCRARGFRNVLLAGFAGQRTDHLLATLHFTAKAKGLRTTLVTSEAMLFLLQGRVQRTWCVPRRHSVSWFGLPRAETCTLTGVRWPFRRRTLRWDGFHSLSNSPVANEIRLQQERGCSVVVISLRPEVFPQHCR